MLKHRVTTNRASRFRDPSAAYRIHAGVAGRTQRSSTGDGIFQVRDSHNAAASIQSDAEDVDPPGQGLEFRVRDQKQLGRREQSPLLGGCYRLLRRDQTISPDLDLDKDEIISLPHDQVELSGRGAPLFRQADVAIRFELPAGEMLSCVTKSLSRCSRQGDVPHAATGEKQRRWCALGPCSARRALWSGEQYPLWSSKP